MSPFHAWIRARERQRSRHEQMVRAAQAMSPLERVGLLCDLATSRDPDARQIARALVKRFPDLPGARWVAEHLEPATVTREAATAKTTP